MRETAAAFLAGVGVMALEVLASRWLSPSFGFTLTTWAFLISATLLAGAFGAALGGRLSRARWPGWMGACLALAGLAFLLSSWMGPILIDALVVWPVRSGAAVAAALLVVPGVVALGAILPLAAHQRGRGAATGSTVGNLVAASTLGSLVGTLATALWWLPEIGTRGTALLLAGILLVAGAWASRRARPRLTSYAAFLTGVGALVLAGFAPSGATGGVLVRETPYGTLQLERRSGAARLRIDGILQGTFETGGEATLLAPDLYVGLLPWLHPRGRAALCVGLGSGRASRLLEPAGVEVTTLEVNPVLAEVVRDELGHAGRVEVGDGRALWRRMDETFDFVLLDAFQGEGLPGHLLTYEAFTELHARLAPGGILSVHLIGRPSHPLTAAVGHTLGAVFPHVLALRTGVEEEIQDVVLLASDAPLRVPPDPSLVERGWTGSEAFELDLSGAVLLTDDHNPVDRLNEPLARALRLCTVANAVRGERPR